MQNSSEIALLDAVKSLIAIRSTADNPAGIRAAYEYVRNMVLNCDKDITIEEFEHDKKPSFLAYRGQVRPGKFRLILNAHLDVVPGKPEQFEAIVRDSKLYGRGVYDMKAAVLVLTQVFCEYVDKLPYAFGLQIVTDEESTGGGTKHQIDQGVRAEFIICGECGRSTNTHEIANEAKGVLRLELTFSGHVNHGAYPWQGENTALMASEFIRKLHELFPVPQLATDETTITVTGLSANGATHSQTPEIATLRLDCRYAPGDVRFESIDTITEFIHSIDPKAIISHFFTFDPPMYTSPHNPLLLDLKAAAEEVEGETFDFVRQNGTSDGRFYSNVSGEACEFGIAGRHQHGYDEYITLDAFRNYLETMCVFMQKTIEASPPTT